MTPNCSVLSNNDDENATKSLGILDSNYGDMMSSLRHLMHRTIADKSTCGGHEAVPWEAHPKGGNYDWV